MAEIISIHKRIDKKAHVSKEELFTKNEDINELFIELGDWLEEITLATGKALGLQAKKADISILTVARSRTKREMLLKMFVSPLQALVADSQI